MFSHNVTILGYPNASCWIFYFTVRKDTEMMANVRLHEKSGAGFKPCNPKLFRALPTYIVVSTWRDWRKRSTSHHCSWCRTNIWTICLSDSETTGWGISLLTPLWGISRLTPLYPTNAPGSQYIVVGGKAVRNAWHGCQVRTTSRSWDKGVLTDLCLKGVLTDLCLTLYIPPVRVAIPFTGMLAVAGDLDRPVWCTGSTFHLFCSRCRL